MSAPIDLKLIWHGRDWELFSEAVFRDFYIEAPGEETGSRWILNEFDSLIEDRLQSHLRTDEFETLQEAIEEACGRVQDLLHDAPKQKSPRHDHEVESRFLLARVFRQHSAPVLGPGSDERLIHENQDFRT